MQKCFRLKDFRFDYDLKQSDVASMFNCHQTNVSRIENQNCDLEKYQYEILYKKYGQEEVDKYKVVYTDGITQNTSDSIVGNNNNNNNFGGAMGKGTFDFIVKQQDQLQIALEQNKILVEQINSLIELIKNKI